MKAPSGGAGEASGRSASAAGRTGEEPPDAGVEAYAYDPALRLHEQRGLDRLRCVEDREIAGLLYNIYLLAERNRARVHAAPADKRGGLIGVRLLARRALDGELGFAARELASNMLLDELGCELAHDNALAAFARAFKRLPRER
jgi:hypothetical protein